MLRGTAASTARSSPDAEFIFFDFSYYGTKINLKLMSKYAFRIWNTTDSVTFEPIASS